MPILLVSASVLPRDVQAAMDAGCDGFLAKPVRVKPLVDEVRRLLDVGDASLGNWQTSRRSRPGLTAGRRSERGSVGQVVSPRVCKTLVFDCGSSILPRPTSIPPRHPRSPQSARNFGVPVRPVLMPPHSPGVDRCGSCGIRAV